MARRQHKLWKLLPLARAIGVLTAVGIVTTLVTFAAIQSSGSALTGNTIQTATASLLVSKDGSFFTPSMVGFNFTGIVPGSTAQPVANNYMVYVKNTGTAAMNLSLTVPVVPTVTGTVDLSKVSVLLTPPSTPGFPAVTQSIALSDLIGGNVALTNGSLAVGGVASFHVQVTMAADAVTGNGANITGLDLSFSGTL